jgi:hypothetical protein
MPPAYKQGMTTQQSETNLRDVGNALLGRDPMTQILMKPSGAIERFRQRVTTAWLVRWNGQSLLEVLGQSLGQTNFVFCDLTEKAAERSQAPQVQGSTDWFLSWLLNMIIETLERWAAAVRIPSQFLNRRDASTASRSSWPEWRKRPK